MPAIKDRDLKQKLNTLQLDYVASHLKWLALLEITKIVVMEDRLGMN